MPINLKLVNRKINLINRDLKSLRKIENISLKKFLAESDYETLAERYLERIIGRMIDINYHILSEENDYTPTDYYNSFTDMGKKNYLPVQLARSLANSAGLRNRLAHEYDEIDEEKIYQAVKKCLNEVPQYIKHIIKFLDKFSKQKRMI
ncbi:DUF86 domain-containing protein [Patescibacteria group bacterium]|nr:DUF86 domain-containing protein [Patescibacteria group bacterium]MBU4347689.1 DUF86 domain-containing protein [Patescibacteria group bacterium]MBU4455201.1 DUF86 domain-containing protein [Patescibacteria group bacterium]